MTLAKRCSDFFLELDNLNASHPPSIDRWVIKVDALRSFVLSEIGRAADERLEDCEPLVLFFADKEGREMLVQAILSVKPGMISKRWPA